MGSGRMAIFESLQHTGSINQTARELNMAYKTVWSKIKSTEKTGAGRWWTQTENRYPADTRREGPAKKIPKAETGLYSCG